MKDKIRKYLSLRLQGIRKLHEDFKFINGKESDFTPLEKYLPVLEFDLLEAVDKYCDCYMMKALAEDVITFFRASLPSDLF